MTLLDTHVLTNQFFAENLFHPSAGMARVSYLQLARIWFHQRVLFKNSLKIILIISNQLTTTQQMRVQTLEYRHRRQVERVLISSSSHQHFIRPSWISVIMSVIVIVIILSQGEGEEGRKTHELDDRKDVLFKVHQRIRVVWISTLVWYSH